MMKIALTLNEYEKTSGLNNAYLKYISNAGYIPITFSNLAKGSAEIAAKICDGLVLKGGNDIEPLHYGMPNICSSNPDPDMDNFERDLIDAFLTEKKPIFGICRGFQLIFIELLRRNLSLPGLSFKQDIKGHQQKMLEVNRYIPYHFVRFNPELYGSKSIPKGLRCFKREEKNEKSYLEIPVNSMHHQGVSMAKAVKPEKFNLLGLPLRILASNDSIVEAFDIQELRILAVQWHPEELNDILLLKGFFEKFNKTQSKAGFAFV